MVDNKQLINTLKKRILELRESGLTHTVHYQELVKQVELLEQDTVSEYVYPGSDCQL